MSLILLLIVILISLLILSIYMYSLFDAGTLLGIRTMPTYQMLSMTFKKLPFNERASIMKEYLQNEDKMIKYLHRGSWGVLIADAGSTERILSDTITFPKLIVSELNPQSAYGQFMGVNVVESNHNTWKYHRRIVSPPFRHQFDHKVFMKLSWKLFEVIDFNKGKPLEVYPIIQNLTIDALGLALLNTEFNSLSGNQTEFLMHYNEFAKGFIKPLYYLFPNLDSAYNPFRRSIFKHLNEINNYLNKLTQQRRQELSDQNIQRNDLLSLLIKASEEDLLWSDIEINNNIRIFFAAGHDTTSNSLTMALYCLAKYPETQAKARKEVLDVLGNDINQMPKQESLQSLHYLTAVIKETLRLYPSLSIPQERITSKDTCLQGYFIPKGTIIMLHLYLLHRDPEYWPNPDQFLPERFLNIKTFETKAYYPFGGKSRFCLGMNFSVILQRIVLANLLRNYKINLSIPDQNATFSQESLLKPVNLCFDFINLN